MEPSAAERPALDQDLRRALTVIRQVFGPSSQLIIVEDNSEEAQEATRES
jgi:hypothetical protein